MKQLEPVRLSPEYVRHLSDNFGALSAHQLAGNVREVDLGHGEYVSYTRAGAALLVPNPVFITQGFTEGILAKAGFAAKLANTGLDVTLPGQNRRKLRTEEFGRERPSGAQAETHLAVMQDAGIGDEIPPIVLAHSYGSVVAQSMVEQDPKRFVGGKLIVIDGAGSVVRENILRLGLRFARYMVHENFTDKDFPDKTGDMRKDGMRIMMANPRRSWAEVKELAHCTVDYEKMLDTFESVTFLSHANGKIFSYKSVMDGMTKAVAAGVSWATPYSTRIEADGRPRGGRDASHNDEQFNPSRSVGAIKQVLSAA